MKVAMVTPMAAGSAIADVMMQAALHLAEHWDLEVWCPTEAEYVDCPVELRSFAAPDDSVVDRLAGYELVIYVLGDSPWHARILPLTRRVPGLTILHDASLTNLIRSEAVATATLDLLVDHVAETVGDDQAESLRTTVTAGHGGWLGFCAEVPLNDVALEGSLGAVVHSVWHARAVDGLTLGSVTVAPLPVPRPTQAAGTPRPHQAVRRLLSLAPSDLLLVTVGNVNPNRRIDALLKAIAADPGLKERLHLWAVGSVDEATRLQLRRQADELGLADRFVLTGRVPDTALDAILERADLTAALRDPVLEGQSASVLTQLLAGKPVIVFDHAHYSELPDDVVVKIDPARAAAELTAALVRLTEDAEERRLRGIRGRRYVTTTRTGDAYADQIRTAAGLALGARPHVRLADDLADRLRRLGLHEHQGVVDTVADLAFELFDLV